MSFLNLIGLSSTRPRYIVFIGPDGCGKSSLADSLALQPALGMTARMSFSFKALPSLSRLAFRKRAKKLPGQVGIGMVPPLPLGRALLLACWYGLDHLLGHLRLRGMRGINAVIFDRSYHDFLYQRAYAKLPSCVPKLFLALGPKPDAVFVPLRDPRTIYADKPELVPSEIAEQYRRIMSACQDRRGVYFVDGHMGFENALAQVQQMLGLCR